MSKTLITSHWGGFLYCPHFKRTIYSVEFHGYQDS